jgi:hypothetical protein
MPNKIGAALLKMVTTKSVHANRWIKSYQLFRQRTSIKIPGWLAARDQNIGQGTN